MIVFVSAIWQTTCTALRVGDEGFVIDSPVLPEELEALPDVLGQAGFPVSGLLCTHADWDHLLVRTVLDGMPLGCAAPTAARLAAEPGAAQRALKAFDAEHYIGDRAALRLTGIQELPLPGRLTLGSGEGDRVSRSWSSIPPQGTLPTEPPTGFPGPPRSPAATISPRWRSR